MTLMGHFPVAVAAAMPLYHSGHITEIQDEVAQPQLEIAAPFGTSHNVVLYSGDLHSFFLRGQFFESSTPGANPISVTVQSMDKSPAELVQEFKRISGLTWAQVASVFEVSTRAPFDWASGKPVSAKNHEKLSLAVASIRFIDRGNAAENRNLLLSEAISRRTYLDLFRAGEFVDAQELAGAGSGRPDFGQTLTSEAEMLTAPRHFGKSLDLATTGDDSEILPISKPKLRRAKARRNKA